MPSNKFLPTLNLVLAIVGYQFATNLAMPFYGIDVESATNQVTIPYRLFTIAIATIVIVQSFRKQKVILKQNRTTKFLMVFWFLLLLRLFYDLQIRTDIFIQQAEAFRIWPYVLLLCLYCGFSVAISYKKIDMHLAFRFTAFALTISLILSLVYNPLLLANSIEIDTRLEGNAALKTIVFGQMGLSAVIIGACMMYSERSIFLKYIIPIFLIIFGALISLRSGSRGPLISFFAIVVFAIIAYSKKPLVGFMAVFLFIGLIVAFSQYILTLIERIAPVLAERLMYTTTNEDRTVLYQEAWERFVYNPFFGDRFAIIYPDGSYIYSHNMILDALMGMGFFGGIIFLAMYFSVTIDAYKLIKYDKKKYMWIVFILIQQMAAGMVSGAFYLKPVLTILIIFIALSTTNYRKVRILYQQTSDKESVSSTKIRTITQNFVRESKIGYRPFV
jgi:O-antigen ligase